MTTDWVVVGHGLSAQGRGWGANIDACKTVVRMWNWHWQNITDYGIRYDWGFLEVHPTEMARYYKHNARIPAKGYVGTVTCAQLHKPYAGPLPVNTQVVDPAPWEEAGKRLGGMGNKGRLGLTRGVRAAAWALERMSQGQTLVLVGFDNVRAGVALSAQQGFPQEYIDCRAAYPMSRYKGENTRREGNHDYGVEGPLLQELASRAKVKLRFAEEVW